MSDMKVHYVVRGPGCQNLCVAKPDEKMRAIRPQIELAMTDSPAQRQAYPCFQPITLRWHDNDIYGHVNNVTYYSFFDTAANTWLIEHGGLDIHEGEVVGFVVSSSCDYFASVAFPERIEVGLRVGKLGNSSVQYELAVFKVGEDEPCAAGRLVHVFVDRASNLPVAIPQGLREALQQLA